MPKLNDYQKRDSFDQGLNTSFVLKNVKPTVRLTVNDKTNHLKFANLPKSSCTKYH